MYHYDFAIADLLVRVNSPFAVESLFELTNFQKEYNPYAQPDAIYTIEILASEWQIRGTKILEDPQNAIYRWQGEEHRYYFWNVASKDLYVLLRHRQDDPQNYSICLQPQKLDTLIPRLRLAAFFFPERLFLQHKALILHSSVIDWNGSGILFTAPSGTGKSTQADLWQRLESASILNGDRAVIRCHQGEYRAHGSPYAGTSGIFCNDSVPIRAIVVLSQAAENTLSRLSPTVAFRQLYKESTVCAWDPDFADELSAILLDLISKVPIYSLACRPDQGAVTILKDALT
ncbi:MAG: hypothetical protein IJW14_02545 [Oscillospiraceae bacterium]|nr:hypothetical protein [Oscillospiraceae bacterium]